MTGTRALFTADWVRPVFIHFRMDPDRLQPYVPLELDLYEGDAYVSLVAFTQARLRPVFGGAVGRWLSAPLAKHEFLNLRTYVRSGADRGIYFMAEWIPNRLAAFIGPRTYGLPYRLGRLRYGFDPRGGRIHGRVSEGPRCLEFRAEHDRDIEFARAGLGSLAEFLVERYIAFTCREGTCRRFDVAHEPWPILPVRLGLGEMELITEILPVLSGTGPAAAHFSPGVEDVRISVPTEVRKSVENYVSAH